MRVTKLLAFCFVTLIAMATGAPRRNKSGRSGERKRQRNPESEKNNLTTVLPARTDEEESEDELRAEFIGMDLNSDDLISLKEFKKAKGNGLTFVFESTDGDKSGKITWEEFMQFKERQISPKVECDKQAMTVCGSRFTDDLREQETVTRRENPKPSTTGLFCSALQAYVNCIGEDRDGCPELDGYAQRMRKTGLGYRSANICPEMDVSPLTPPHSERRQRPDRRERTQSRETRSADERTLSEENCLGDAFSSCHDDLYDALGSDSVDCTLGNYRECLSESTERCPDKGRVKSIISGLKYMEKEHRQEGICIILSAPSAAPVTSALTEPRVPCDRFVLERCGNKFAEDLRQQEEILQAASQRPSTTGLFCTAMQDYVNCIGEQRSGCRELNGYAQRIKKTSVAYRSAEICPEMDVSTLTSRHSDGRQRTERRERTLSRETRAANERTLSNEDCLRDAFSSCHDDLYDALGVRARGCTLFKRYRTCLTKSTKRCRDKQRVRGIISGLKYIRKVHKQGDMCVLQT